MLLTGQHLGGHAPAARFLHGLQGFGGVGEAADLSCLDVHQLEDTVLRCMTTYRWTVLVGIGQITTDRPRKNCRTVHP